MELILNAVEKMTLVEFADKHGFSFIIEERLNYEKENLPRYFGEFDPMVEIKDGCILESVCGNGMTIGDVLDDYRKKISGKLIVVNAMKNSRKEIQVPLLIAKEI